MRHLARRVGNAVSSGPSPATAPTKWTGRHPGMGSGPDTTPEGPLPVGIVGAGRVGTALAPRFALPASPSGAGRARRAPAGCDAIRAVRPRRARSPSPPHGVSAAAPLVGHTSGATPLSALATPGAQAFACTRFRRSPARGRPLRGRRRGRGGHDARAHSRFAARWLARRGMRPFDDRRRGSRRLPRRRLDRLELARHPGGGRRAHRRGPASGADRAAARAARPRRRSRTGPSRRRAGADRPGGPRRRRDGGARSGPRSRNARRSSSRCSTRWSSATRALAGRDRAVAA